MAYKKVGRLFGDQRPRSCGPNHNARVLNDTALGDERGSSDRKHWKVERASPPQLPVGAPPSVQGIQKNFRKNFVGPPLDVIQAVIVIEVGERNLPLARSRNQT